MISFNMPDPSLAFKRKRFSRQVKESLSKFYSDLNNLMDLRKEE